MKKIYSLLVFVSCLYSATYFSQCSTASVVPYYEGFAITANNQLPACWAISNPSTCITLTTSPTQGYAAFTYSSAGASFFYSNGIQLNAGVTYSTVAAYKVLAYTYTNVVWTDFSILLGTSQSSTGLVSLASTNGNVVNTVYSGLTNTFVVSTSGVYYFAIRGTSNGSSSGASLLIWDDFSVTMPCAYNSPTLTLTVSSPTICFGDTYTASISGANTYSWSDGSTGSVNTYTPNSSLSYFVLGTSTLSGCTSTLSSTIVVNPAPSLFISTNVSSICLGNSANLNAFTNGATSYSWTTGSTFSTVSVSPSISTTYSITVINTYSCSSTASISINVNPLPVITYSNSAASSMVCKGDLVTFTLTTQQNVNYLSSITSGQTFGGSEFSFVAPATTTITMNATETVNGCQNSTAYVLNADNCTALKNSSQALSSKIYPNPGNGIYTLESGNLELKSLVITDMMGKIVFSIKTYTAEIKIDIREFPKGIYYAKVITEGKINSVKLVKE